MVILKVSGQNIGVGNKCLNSLRKFYCALKLRIEYLDISSHIWLLKELKVFCGTILYISRYDSLLLFQSVLLPFIASLSFTHAYSLLLLLCLFHSLLYSLFWVFIQIIFITFSFNLHGLFILL